MERRALLVVDVQQDFCPGGALAVAGGDKIIPKLNAVIRSFEEAGRHVFFSRDWHPRNHCSFTSQGGKWPPHCVKGTKGAEFHPALHVPAAATIVSKATRPDEEAYSAFEGTALETKLKRMGVTNLVVGGLATDYCVKNTVLDALAAGFAVDVMQDCTRGVNLRKTDSAKAIDAMVGKGARMTNSAIGAHRNDRRAAVMSSS